MRSIGFIFSFAVLSVAIASPKISIYYALPNKPFGVKVLEDGQDVASTPMKLLLRNAQSHKAAHETLKKVSNYFEREFNWNSYDGRGREIQAVVGVGRMQILRSFGALKQNAAWHPVRQQFLLGAGGGELDSFEKGIDVIAHEYTHAVIKSTSRLNHVGQAGALGESLSDVFGEMIDQELNPSAVKWVIGESVLTEKLKTLIRNSTRPQIRGLRDMLRPLDSFSPQPSHMRSIPQALGPGCIPQAENDFCGVHILNGIPNRASAIMVEILGWAKMKPVFFNVMTQKLKPDSDFQDFSRQMQISCYELLEATDCVAVRDSLAEVGL